MSITLECLYYTSWLSCGNNIRGLAYIDADIIGARNDYSVAIHSLHDNV